MTAGSVIRSREWDMKVGQIRGPRDNDITIFTISKHERKAPLKMIIRHDPSCDRLAGRVLLGDTYSERTFVVHLDIFDSHRQPSNDQRQT